MPVTDAQMAKGYEQAQAALKVQLYQFSPEFRDLDQPEMGALYGQGNALQAALAAARRAPSA